MTKRVFSGYHIFLLSVILLLAAGCHTNQNREKRILVFSKTAGFHHASIGEGVKAVVKMGEENGIIVDTTTDSRYFTEDSLKHYSAVVFVSTTGDVLNFQQQADFERYIQAGGGFLGIHAAADTEHDWPWYGRLVGAYFKNHPVPQEALVKRHRDPDFGSLDSLPESFKWFDEWYNFKELPKDVKVLAEVDEKSYTGGENGAYHPIVWYHDFDGGRAFYLELGHPDEVYKDPTYLTFLKSGLDYAIGKNKPLDYARATAPRKPDENRFEKKLLSSDINQPTELTVLPNLDILVAEWGGDIKWYNHTDKTLKKIAHINVYNKALMAKNVNVETGLLGIHADPDYEKNHWIYVYYSPVDTSVDRLSRFKFNDGRFDLGTEQVILEVKTDREICCHTGGSIAFDGTGNLFLSVGDNTTPFDEVDPATGKKFPYNLHGYSPLDDRPGFENFDDRRASGNSNDLRGKILRIKVNEDGSYDIPDGNLFAKNNAKARPEIYVMGGRNLYRISVDKHTGFVYWGDVGPDARSDSFDTRGPKGYDEVNQARKSGNFGWPYFIGPNYPYVEYNYATGESGKKFDPDHPVNNSRNNTGLVDLPPAMPAFIWYPYDESTDFPYLGTGGRTAMAGPVYYVDDFPKETRYPAYFNKKLFVYDWMRDWIMAVTMNDKGDYEYLEPFMSGAQFSNISDMEVGPDGRLYIVEYGKGWFTDNADAGLSVLDFNGGNRAPSGTMSLNQTSGNAPFQIQTRADVVDPDSDPLSYTWYFGTDSVVSDQAGVAYTFQKNGVFPVYLKVSDKKGGVYTTSKQDVFVGNNRPQVKIDIEGNTSFYFPGKAIRYHVSVNDAEDGSSESATFDKNKIRVLSGNFDSYQSAVQNLQSVTGEHHQQLPAMISSLDCQSCHKVNGSSVGPSFIQVSQKYEDNGKNISYLIDKIISGGSGVWGERAMPAHPKLKKEDAQNIVNWIFALKASGDAGKSLPLSGSVVPKINDANPKEVLSIAATYEDNGAKGIPPLIGAGMVVLKNPLVDLDSAMFSGNISVYKSSTQTFRIISESNSWIKLSGISLNDIKSITLKYALGSTSENGAWSADVYLDEMGENKNNAIGNMAIDGKGKARTQMDKTLVLKNVDNEKNKKHDVYLNFIKTDNNDIPPLIVSGIRFNN